MTREENILNDYIDKIPLKDIKSKYKVGSDTIYKIVDATGVRRANKKDLSLFYDLENPELQYWLGYICADGNIQYSKQHRQYKVSLHSVDEEVILKFKKFFGKIVNIHRRPTGVIEGYINSKELCEYFMNTLNIQPAKSLTLIPNVEFTKNFILGYFDGDGSITNSTESRTRYETKFTSGSKEFLEKISELLTKEGIYHTIDSKGNAFDLNMYKKEESRRFYHWLYSDMVVCLSRKFNNFVALFGNIEVNNGKNCGKLNGQSAADLSE